MRSYKKTIMIENPGFRDSLEYDIRNLSDKDYQLNNWVNPNYTHSFWDDFGNCVSFIFDTLCLDEDPTDHIGYTLFNQEEADVIQLLTDAMEKVILRIGEGKPDEAYYKSPLWDDVVEAAKKAYDLMKANDEKYRFDQIYQEYLEKCRQEEIENNKNNS